MEKRGRPSYILKYTKYTNSRQIDKNTHETLKRMSRKPPRKFRSPGSESPLKKDNKETNKKKCLELIYNLDDLN